jgi:hypothetical protein
MLVYLGNTCSCSLLITDSLQVVSIPGAESLPSRLREAHLEIRAGSGMTRAEFKQALREQE